MVGYPARGWLLLSRSKSKLGSHTVESKKIKFYQSLQFKIALVFILMLVLTLEIVGAVFVRQLERANLNTFKQQIELPVSVTNSLARSLSIDNANEANQQIKTTIQQLSNPNLTELNVVDAKGITRGTNQKKVNEW